MASGIKRKVELSDGTVCEVGDRQFAAISSLRQAIDDVARGVVLNLSLVETDGVRGVRSALFTLSAEGLPVLADELVHQNKVARHVAASWEGNVRGEARSYLEH